MLKNYMEHFEERKKIGIPPLPLNAHQTQELCKLLEIPGDSDKDILYHLLSERIVPGVDDSSKIKAEWLFKVAKKEIKSSVIDEKNAIMLLGTMLGGYNINPLIELLKTDMASFAAESLKKTILIYNEFENVANLSKKNKFAADIIQSWANGEWFTNCLPLPEIITLKVFKVDGEINTDDFSPAGQAWSRPDIPLHALSMGETRFPGEITTIEKFKNEGFKVAFVGDVIGTGSSRKSACNSVMWHIGEDIPFIPNKKRGGIVIGNSIAPIFFNTTEDSGGLPILTDVSKMSTGDIITIDTHNGLILNEKKETISTFKIHPTSLKDEFRAGGRLNLIIGSSLTKKARKFLNLNESDLFISQKESVPKKNQGYSLAQKIVGQACGLEGVLPGTACQPKMTTVGSQDTTGPMTADELKELACLEFQADLYMQSFCHTAAYPKTSDVEMHKNLPEFTTLRKGVTLHPGDGVIHSWLNRLLLPDTVGTGGDSHTRFPIGISFPAGSGLVAFAGALGFMPLDMPESVLVKFKNNLNEGITLRDAVNAIPYFAIQQGLLTVEKKNKKNIFNGRIVEMEGLPNLTVEQAFELTDATAERSAAAGTIKLSVESVANYLQSNISLMEKMIENGYQHKETLKNRIKSCENWLKNPILLERDENAEFAAVIEIDLSKITEPILACPNDPDDVKLLSDVSGTKIDDVFIGSCMTNIGHFRAAGEIWRGLKEAPTKIWLTPPTAMDKTQLMKEGYYSIFSRIGARTEIPGCSLCMGNQARVKSKSTVFSTSTRNFDNRIGDGAKVYLGSAELAAVTAALGEIPTLNQYHEAISNNILNKSDKIYKYLNFDKMPGFSINY